MTGVITYCRRNKKQTQKENVTFVEKELREEKEHIINEISKAS